MGKTCRFVVRFISLLISFVCKVKVKVKELCFFDSRSTARLTFPDDQYVLSDGGFDQTVLSFCRNHLNNCCYLKIYNFPQTLIFACSLGNLIYPVPILLGRYLRWTSVLPRRLSTSALLVACAK